MLLDGGEIIAGDNLAVMRSLATDGRRFHLIYADPPYNSGDDYRHTDGRLAFTDRWPSLSAYLDHIRERVAAARDLLTRDGSLVVHVSHRTAYDVKPVVDEVFGRACFASSIVWRYRRWPTKAKNFQRVHEVLLRYVRDPSVEPRWTQLYEPLAASTVETWGTQKQRAVVVDGVRRRSRATEETSVGVALGDVWEIPIVAPVAKERTGYPTQKPIKLLERLIGALTLEGDDVLDPYCGSGTTLEASRKLGRRYVGIDSGDVALEVCRARLAQLGSSGAAAATT